MCRRYGLAIGSRLVWLYVIICVLVYVIAKPMAMILDSCLGDEIGKVYSQNELAVVVALDQKQVGGPPPPLLLLPPLPPPPPPAPLLLLVAAAGCCCCCYDGWLLLYRLAVSNLGTRTHARTHPHTDDRAPQGTMGEYAGKAIQGALKCLDTPVERVMTNIDLVFTLTDKDLLDYNTISTIFRSGQNHVPVLSSQDPNLVVGILKAAVSEREGGREKDRRECERARDLE